MRKILRAFGLAAAIGAGLSACYPERASEGTDYASITTVYDSLFAFDSAATFYVPDSVVHLGTPDNVSHVYDSLIVARIAANMISRGYTRAVDPALADLTLNPAVLVNENYDYAGADWCLVWGWAYPWICTGWIPDYPGDVIGYTYSTGTLFIPMANLADGVPPAVSRPPVVWLAGINGVVSGSSSSALAAGIADGINQAFAQSPYIGRSTP
ncbi:MAG TPA: DUF4136 domain-containing protein [Gemmatimonadales bacterium]|nr:DUF4136 domain-containing protein [Gemmatimonadales bacterium]